MSNVIKIFENEEFGRVRTIIKDGEPWFVGKDVAEILEYRNTKKALSDHVDEEDKYQGDPVIAKLSEMFPDIHITHEWDDEYELIELFGQPALFTNDRITDADIPKGMHCYHIRHGDEGEFVSIEKHTAVNHAGSVVTKEPIDLGEQGYISFTDDTSPDFKGEIMSLYEFWEYDPEQSQTEDLEMEMK